MPRTERLYYRTKDSSADYGFEFRTMPDGSERAYIFSQPSYQGRDEGLHPTHRRPDVNTQEKYVCWDQKIYSRGECKEVAKLWADSTQAYVNSGTRFGPA